MQKVNGLFQSGLVADCTYVYTIVCGYFDIRSDEGLTLETSAFRIFHGGNSTFINSFDETKVITRLYAIATLDDWLKNLAPVLQPVEAKSKPMTQFFPRFE